MILIKNIFRHVLIFFASTYFELKALYWKNTTKSVHNIKVHKGFQFKFFKYGDITKLLYTKQHLIKYKKSFEYDNLELFTELVKEGDIVLDVGANVGLYSLLAAEIIGSKGKVFAIEPAQFAYNALAQNIELNKYKDLVYPFNIALSNHNGFIEMEIPASTLDSFKDKDAFAYINLDAKNGSIEAVKLDDFISTNQIEKIDIIKMDIEGAELLCFRGATTFFKNNKPIILFEGYEKNCQRFNYKLIELLEFLREYNYDLTQINSETWLATPIK